MLPRDVARCPGTRCEVRESCRRNQDSGDPRYTRWMDFSSMGPLVTRLDQCANAVPMPTGTEGGQLHA